MEIFSLLCAVSLLTCTHSIKAKPGYTKVHPVHHAYHFVTNRTATVVSNDGILVLSIANISNPLVVCTVIVTTEL